MPGIIGILGDTRYARDARGQTFAWGAGGLGIFGVCVVGVGDLEVHKGICARGVPIDGHDEDLRGEWGSVRSDGLWWWWW